MQCLGYSLDIFQLLPCVFMLSQWRCRLASLHLSSAVLVYMVEFQLACAGGVADCWYLLPAPVLTNQELPVKTVLQAKEEQWGNYHRSCREGRGKMYVKCREIWDLTCVHFSRGFCVTAKTHGCDSLCVDKMRFNVIIGDTFS